MRCQTLDEQTAKQKKLCVFDSKCSHIFQAHLRQHPGTNTWTFLVFIFSRQSCKCTFCEEPLKMNQSSLRLSWFLPQKSLPPKKTTHVFGKHDNSKEQQPAWRFEWICGSTQTFDFSHRGSLFPIFNQAEWFFLFRYDCFLVLLW